MFRLTPLNALRALEACARHGSHTRAGEELGVTPSAIRFQIRHLEDLIDQPLFRRNGPQLEVLPNTLAVLSQLRDGLQILDNSYQTLKTLRVNTLSICPDISFSALWLAPNLPDFKAKHPGLEVNFLSRIGGLGQTVNKFDVEISSHFPPSENPPHILTRETFLPLCSPAYQRKYSKADNIEAIRFLDIEPMNTSDPYPNWEKWGAKFEPDLTMHRNSYSLAILALQAAVNGEGIVLASELLARDMIEKGTLIVPAAYLGKTLQCPRYARIVNSYNKYSELFLEWLEGALVSAEGCRGNLS